MRASSRLLCIVTGPLLLTAAHCLCLRAEDSTKPSSDLMTLLARPVLSEKQTLAEVRKFCDRRIAVMPNPITWSAWQREAERIERSVLEDVVFRGVPAAWRDASRRVEWLDTIPGGPGYQIRKLRYEALPGLWIPALLYEPDQLKGRVPVVLNVNGHDSKGKAAPYKQIRCINLAKRGMLALNLEWLGMGQLQGDGFSHNRMNQLDLCGTSGLAVFYLAMQRGLDILVDHPHADVERVAMAGLSGGGWQTILLSSLDRRVTLSQPGGRLLELQDARRILLRPGRFGANADRSGDARRLHASDRPAGAAPHAADVQRQGRMLLSRGPRAAAAPRCRIADFQVGGRRHAAALARQRRSRHAQLRARESRGVLQNARRSFLRRRRLV